MGAMKTAGLILVMSVLAGCAASPLNEAIARQDLAEVKRLVEAGADLDKRDNAGVRSAPLPTAVEKGTPEIVAYLVKKGAGHRSEALSFASRLNLPEMVDALLYGAKDGGDAVPPPSARSLCKALVKGDYAGAAALLDRGVDPSARVDDGYSLFNCAIQGKRADLVRLLIERGAKRSAAFESPGWGKPSDFQFAQQTGQTEILALFGEEPRKTPGNLDDAAYARMRAAAGLAPERKEPASDIDSPARRGAPRPDDFALVIGIEEYQSVPRADFGARDARTVARHLEALGFPARNVVSLEGSQATGSKLRSYLEEWLPLNVGPASTLFVYFSGHGAHDGKTGEAYLVPWDGDPKFLKSTALTLKNLYASLEKTKAKRVIVALDACFSGTGGRSVLSQGARPLAAKVGDLSPAGGKITLLAAASADEITGSLDEQGHGMFTYHLLKGLAADAKASARSLLKYVLPRLQDDARRQNRVQTPVFTGASLDEPLLSR